MYVSTVSTFPFDFWGILKIRKIILSSVGKISNKNRVRVKNSNNNKDKPVKNKLINGIKE